MREKRLLLSFKCAFFGLFYCLKTQKNFRFHLLIAILVLSLAWCLGLEKIELLILLLTILLVLVLEMVNTGFELLIDMIVPDWNERARMVKDVAAAAVLLAAIGAVIIGIIIFRP